MALTAEQKTLAVALRLGGTKIKDVALRIGVEKSVVEHYFAYIGLKLSAEHRSAAYRKVSPDLIEAIRSARAAGKTGPQIAAELGISLD